jgi:hypothetical protein
LFRLNRSSVSDEPLEQAGLQQAGIAAALAQSYAQDAHELLPLLATFLEGLIPENVEIEHKSLGWFSGKTRIVGLKYTIGDLVYSLHESANGKALEAHRIRVVRGVTLKTETIPVNAFLEEMAHSLSERSNQNESALFALKDFLKL